MKINNNISAVITNKQLLRTENNLSKSVERLSSGLKINHASDSPAGMAISHKMQAQIEGLDQASRNASDVISVLETADGALDAITQMLQRVRELAVQAANDTNSLEEREAIQIEIEHLKTEVDRVATTTEFNTKSLLDGSIDKRVYADHMSRISVSDEVTEGEYQLKVDDVGYSAELATGINCTALVGSSGSISINGSTANITSDMTEDEIYDAIRTAGQLGGTEVTGNKTSGMAFSSKMPGRNNHVEITVSGDLTSAIGGVAAGDRDSTRTPTAAYNPDGSVTYWDTGEDPKITLGSGFTAQTTVTCENGNHVTIADAGGFSIDFLLDAETPKGTDITLDVTDNGPENMQIGANEGQQLLVRIPGVTAKDLYLDDVDVTVVGGADKAISRMDTAIAKVNSVRATVGAYSNRLEHTIASLDQTHENMTAAISRITDTNMAEEMTEYTKYQVLQQAATSVLSQANELPQQALQLLG